MSETKLLPCPFCGGKAEFGDGINALEVGCAIGNRCLVSPYIPRDSIEFPPGIDVERDLARIWNTRAPGPSFALIPELQPTKGDG